MNTNQDHSSNHISQFFVVLFSEFSNIVLLNLLLCLTMITIVGIPASLTAASYIFTRMMRRLPFNVKKDYFRVFKAEFRKSLGAGAVLMGIILLSLFSLSIYNQMRSQNELMIIPMLLSLMITVLAIFMSYFVFPMIGIVNLPLKAILMNAFRLSVIRVFYNLATFLSVGVLSAVYFYFFPLSLIGVALFYFAPICLMTTWCGYSGIERYVLIGSAIPPEEENEEE